MVVRNLDLSYPTIVSSLVEAVPELRAALAQHVRDNDVVMQHVFFGCDVVPFVLAACKAGDVEIVGRCLAVLEAALTCSDERTRGLVSVSFVEQVGPWESDMGSFVGAWPPALAQEATHYA